MIAMLVLACTGLCLILIILVLRRVLAGLDILTTQVAKGAARWRAQPSR